MRPIHYPTPATFTRQKSAELFATAQTCFPGGVHSPVRAFKSVQGPPIFFESGSGAHLFDVDGQAYIDFCCSWGPLILGHAPTAVVESVRRTAENGLSFGAPSVHDLPIGRLILDNHRYIEMIRFVSSGTEAVMSAIRLARGVTGRDKILKFEGCYHGHADALLIKAGSGLATFGIKTSAGVPASAIGDTLVAPLADATALEKILEKHGHEIACIILEPVPANHGLLLQEKSYLQQLRASCTAHGILLIFDEVISGFRLGFEGAAGHYGI